MLRSIALGCVDRRSKPGDGNVGESLEDVLAPELSMGDGESASNDAGVGQGRSGKTKLNVKNVMKNHLQGTKRVRLCLLLTPVLMLLVMLTRPLYAPLIDVFGPTEQELRARAKSGAAAEARVGEGSARVRRTRVRGATECTSVTPLRPGKCQSARPLNETCRGELLYRHSLSGALRGEVGVRCPPPPPPRFP